METTSKAVEIRTFGSPEGLAVIDLPDPSPADGRVLIATEAIGVGGVDTMIRSGVIAGYGFNPNGRMVVVGVVAGYPPADFGMTMMAAFQKSLSFATFSTDGELKVPARQAIELSVPSSVFRRLV